MKNKLYDKINEEFNKIQKNNQIQLNYHLELKQRVIEATSFLDKDASNSERVYCIRNYITEQPKCPVCNHKIKFNKKITKYNQYCSKLCANRSKLKLKKAKETCLKKYGTDNPMKNDDIKNKALSHNDLKENGKRLRKFIKENMKVNSPMEIDNIKEKVKKTCLKKYGTDNPMKNDDIKNKLSKKISENSYFDIISRPDFLGRVIPLFSKKEYTGISNHKKYKYKCNKCGLVFSDWIDSSYKLIPRCPNCYPKIVSLFEKEIQDYVINLVGKDNVILNDREILKGKELDIYIPKENFAIECNGLFWHSDMVHPDPNYHLNKTIECNKQGIRLIHIFEDEWTYKKEILKGKLAYILKKNNNKRIYARKCSIKEISSKEKNEFLISNHIQGKDISKIKLGLFYEDKLMSVMTFCKPRKSLGQKDSKFDYELSRFASNSDYIVIGGFGKLFKYFERNYDWSSIITYADKRYSEGNVYFKNNFKLLHESKPNYWYIKRNDNKGIRFHRYQFRKQNLKKLFPDTYDENKTEKELMKENGYLRVYDCGNYVFEYKKENQQRNF